MPADLAYDIERPLAAYFKADATLQALVGGVGGVRVYSDGPPRKAWEQIAPFVNLFRIPGGGAPAGVTLPEDRPWVQADCWAKDKPSARKVAQAVANAAGRVQGPVRLPIADGNPAATLLGIWRMQGPGWMPDPTTDRPRFTMTLVVTVVWATP